LTTVEDDVGSAIDLEHVRGDVEPDHRVYEGDPDDLCLGP
jgi:hypothetical protein